MLQKFNLEKRNLIPVIFILADIVIKLVRQIISLSPFNITNAISYISLILVFVYALSVNTEYKQKQYLLPVSFGMSIIWSLVLLFFNIKSIGFPLYFEGIFDSVENAVSMVASLVSYASMILMLFGTIGNFKHPELFKIGAIILVVFSIIPLITNPIAWIKYANAVGEEINVIDDMVISIISLTATLLYRIAVFLLAKDMCKEKKAVN